MNIQDLIEFVHNLKKKEKDYFQIAMISFYVEGLFFWDYNIEKDQIDMREVFSKVPKELLSILHPCALEFFFSNNYRSPKGEYWNVIESYIQKKAKSLRNTDLDYLNALKDSYMGLYEVVDIDPHKSITLKSLIKGEEEEIIVKEKKGTEQLVKWDVLGARIIHTKKNALLAGGVLTLSRRAAKKAKQSIENISSLMMNKTYLESIDAVDPNPMLTVKKMWVKEIVEEWFSEKSKMNQEPAFLNSDGETLEQVLITFPILATRRTVEIILNELPEFILTEEDEWLWPHTPTKNAKKDKHDNPFYFETYFTNSETGKSFPIYTTLQITGKFLAVETNSHKRAQKVINFIQMIFNEKLGVPHIETKIHPAILEVQKPKSTKGKSKAIQEQNDQLIKEFSKSYYDCWVDMPIVALNDKTPREACKTKSGKAEVIEILKEMQSTQERLYKLNGKEMFYDLKKILNELGIKSL